MAGEASNTQGSSMKERAAMFEIGEKTGIGAWLRRKNGAALAPKAARTTLAGIALVLVLLPASVLAQGEPDLRAELRERAVTAGLAEADQARMEQRLVRIQTANLPVRPVLDRYLQGLAKAVPFSRIESVVDLLEARLRDAARRVDDVFPLARTGPDSPARLALIDDGAYAIGAGVPPAGVAAALRLAAKEQDGPAAAAAPVLAIGCLAASGMAPDRSAEFVREAWERGFRGMELERLGRDVAGLGHPGQGPPSAAIDQLRGMMREGADRDRILHHLDALRGLEGYRGPGVGPGQDPGQMRGPGGPPHDPGRVGPGNPPSPPPRGRR
jgi:hypothetical protein